MLLPLKMCEYCYEQTFSEVMVKEMRNGLYHIDLHLYPPDEQIDGFFREIIQLPGSHSDRTRRYKIIYNDECYTYRFAFMLTVEEMPSISGSEMSTANSSLIDDQEKPQTKSQKFGETSFLSEDLDAKPSCPVQVWIKTNYEKAASSKSSMLPMVKYGSNKWRMEVTNPINPDNRYYYRIYPCSITILIDLGTPVRERNVIMMSDGLAEMFYNQHLCDVHFDFKDSQTVGAHVVILSAGSPVFSAMFRSEFLKSKTKKVTITDIDIEVFRQLLIYLYTGSAPKLAQENMTQLLFEAADKYNIDNLKTECTDVLLKRVNLENAISLLVWSHFHSVGNLKEATLKFLAANSLRIFSQPEWMDLIKNYPELCLLATQHMSKLLNKTNKTAKST